MGVTIEQYRATIGTFSRGFVLISVYLFKPSLMSGIFSYLFLKFYRDAKPLTKCNIQRLNELLINICTLCIALNVLLRLYGDIELDPGPVSTESLSVLNSSSFTIHDSSDILHTKLNLSLVHLNIRSLLPKFRPLVG